MTGGDTEARSIAKDLIDQFHSRFPKAIKTLEEDLEDSLSFYAYPALDTRKISSKI